MVDSIELHARIVARAEDFVRELFGERARAASANKWRVGSHGSLAIEIRDGRLVWFDHEGGGSGDAVDLWQRERSGTTGDALRACAAWCGVSAGAPTPTQPPRQSKERPRRQMPEMPAATFLAWRNGRAFLWDGRNGFRNEAIADLAAWRGWPADFVQTLIRTGLLSAPRVYRELARAAFPVCEPVPWPERAHRDRARFVGFHARMREAPDGSGGWRFHPCADKNADGHPGLPTLPLLLSGTGFGGELWAARVLVITEGEWDALTLALAAGWFDLELGILRIPPAVTLCGISGANGAAALLNYYAPFWPDDLDVLVLRDADKGGDGWLAPGGFVDALRARCCRVQSFNFGTGASGKRRDVNDLWREGKLTRALLDAMLASVGWTLHDAETTPAAGNDAPPPRERSEGTKISNEHTQPTSTRA